MDGILTLSRTALETDLWRYLSAIIVEDFCNDGFGIHLLEDPTAAIQRGQNHRRLNNQSVSKSIRLSVTVRFERGDDPAKESRVGIIIDRDFKRQSFGDHIRWLDRNRTGGDVDFKAADFGQRLSALQAHNTRLGKDFRYLQERNALSHRRGLQTSKKNGAQRHGRHITKTQQSSQPHSQTLG